MTYRLGKGTTKRDAFEDIIKEGGPGAMNIRKTMEQGTADSIALESPTGRVPLWVRQDDPVPKGRAAEYQMIGTQNRNDNNSIRAEQLRPGVGTHNELAVSTTGNTSARIAYRRNIPMFCLPNIETWGSSLTIFIGVLCMMVISRKRTVVTMWI